MSFLLLVAACAALLLLAYRTYGAFLERWMQPDQRPTPAASINDGEDFVPGSRWVVTGQHFTAIAAAGPVVGPILAGMAFGWVPALVWILVGAVFVGGAHDMGTLFASVRHRAASIAEVVRTRMSRPAYLVFLVFVWLSLVYVIIAFTDLTASSFARMVAFDLGGAEAGRTVLVDGGGVATAAIAYLVVSVLVGLGFRYLRLPEWAGAVVGVVAVGLAIWFGQLWPVALPPGLADGNRFWNMTLLGYCFLASVLPMWLLLQPRGLLGSLFLYAVLAAGVGGTLLGGLSGGLSMDYPAFKGFDSAVPGPLLPFLFITVTCGACSGFHSIVSSGTTSKQVARESHIRLVGYGSMLMEAMVAVLALGTLVLAGRAAAATPDAVFAQGIGRFLAFFGIPAAFGTTFGLLAFSTFIFDTLDVCTRLGRYVFQELTGWKSRWAGWAATAATLVFPAFYLWSAPAGAWRQFWTIFGTSNQLLAALTLTGLAVWFRGEGRRPWPMLLPAVFMLAMSGAALFYNLRSFVAMGRGELPLPRGMDAATLHLNIGIACALALLGLFVTWEAVRALRRPVPARG